jgi:hypothetical protein
MQVTDSPEPASIFDILDRAVANRTATRADPVGQLVLSVLAAADPDAVLVDLMRAMLTGYVWATRKKKITMVATAFGAERRAFKNYLRARAVCGPND